MTDAQYIQLRNLIRALTDRLNGMPQGILYANLGETLVDDQTPGIVQFDVPSNMVKAELYLSRSAFPKAFYSELPYHRHAGVAGSAHTHPVPNHQHAVNDHNHTVPDHNHGAGSLVLPTGSVAHQHSGVTTGSGNTGNSATPYTDIAITGSVSDKTSLSTNNKTSLTTATDGSCTSGAPDTTTYSGYQGINAATLNDTEKTNVDDNIDVYITTSITTGWGTAYDKASTGWSAMGNLDTNAGTGWIDITSYLTAGSFHWMKFVEPTAKTGGRILATIRFSFVDQSTI